MSVHRGAVLAVALTFVLVAGAQAQATDRADQTDRDDVLLRALTDELERSRSELRVIGLEAPYYLAYRVDEIEAVSAEASFGSLLTRRENRARLLTVEVRVGSYELDNTNFVTLSALSAGLSGTFGGLTPLPLDDDYQEIRRQLWLATDSAYKAALEQLARKRSLLQNKTLADDLDDFSRVAALTIDESPEPPAGGPGPVLEALAVDLSALLRGFEAVFESQVEVTVGSTRTTFVNSEGTRSRTSTQGVRLVAEASGQATDGMPLEDQYLAVAERFEELPAREILVREVSGLGERLTALRSAELLERYNGPVLFEPQAAAELVVQGFAPQLSSRREPLIGDERLAGLRDRNGQNGFEDRIGARVLPRFMAITDDPRSRRWGNQRLLGGYPVDDQGVPANPTLLVERGYLKTLLSGRTPVVGVGKSTGNWRGGGVMPSNLMVTATTRMTDEELRAELLLLVADRGAEFGVIVRRLGVADVASSRRRRQSGSRGRPEAGEIAPVIVASKVYPDGREVPLRNVEISGFAAAAFKDIVGVGSADAVYSTPFAPRSGNPLSGLGAGASFGGFGGPPITTIVVPALLFEEVTLRKPGDEIPSLPVAGHPFFAESPDV